MSQTNSNSTSFIVPFESLTESKVSDNHNRKTTKGNVNQISILRQREIGCKKVSSSPVTLILGDPTAWPI